MLLSTLHGRIQGELWPRCLFTFQSHPFGADLCAAERGGLWELRRPPRCGSLPSRLLPERLRRCADTRHWINFQRWGTNSEGGPLWAQNCALWCFVFFYIPWWKYPSLGPVALSMAHPACLLRFPFRSCRRRWLWSVCWMSCVKWLRTSGSLCSCKTTPTFSRPPWVSGDTLGMQWSFSIDLIVK